LAPNSDAAASKLHLVDSQLAAALALALQVKNNASTSAVADVTQRAHQLLYRLRTGWNEMGLWSKDPKADASPEAVFETRMAERELAFRMRSIRRECLWTEKELSPRRRPSTLATVGQPGASSGGPALALPPHTPGSELISKLHFRLELAHQKLVG
jgi:hypothetical protein